MPPIKVASNPVSFEELKKIIHLDYGELVKAVVDIEKNIIAFGGEMHADEEKLLLEQGSKQTNLWGINLYPDQFGTDEFIEFNSMINLRPSQGNRSRGVDDEEIQKRIVEVVSRLISK
ncbi:hypothetical protein A2690_05065 [Candidatus Roizmanbacteria bacterium RIFCSPHIGHO2_01_FULL_39_12b]|uniref:Uncharacterized protein n=1 Tax=Candidatus Roizmanbacteria bacterium RIFCSPHIGHO2_01_FULL_39_12b TaxID=1802030 RepID=A0A1F7G8Z4_9BACT|nr:MAG: hypothetical protein A2690_05065 [Candidatus Roizmanbacteria bacterium RIFCSPHIGHO2_01_FULL_39_12b]OGK45917.1 MAG: hypothetical protein A3B46_03425 [Candidatus Roizmanbacteria bacterium RIFCSPLOWO2_01_FULL_39_19]